MRVRDGHTMLPSRASSHVYVCLRCPGYEHVPWERSEGQSSWLMVIRRHENAEDEVNPTSDNIVCTNPSTAMQSGSMSQAISVNKAHRPRRVSICIKACMKW